MAGHIESSKNIDWTTPQWVVDACRKVFPNNRIVLDPCSNPHSIVKADIEYMLSKGNDGLKDSWNAESVYVNPPFGVCYVNVEKDSVLTPKEFRRLTKGDKEYVPTKEDAEFASSHRRTDIKMWLQRCADARKDHGSEVIALIPAAVDTAHWQKNIFKTADAVCFPKGRMKFGVPPPPADMPEVEKLKWPKAGPAPMATALPYWGSNTTGFIDVFEQFGTVINLRAKQH
jgi:hypothetical protein